MSHAVIAPRECLSEAMTLGKYTGYLGLILGAAHLSWNNTVPIGYSAPRYLAMTTGQGALLGAVVAASACSFNQLRHSEDEFGSAFGGFIGGAAIGLRQKSLGMAFGLGAGLAFAGYVFEANGRSLRGPIGNMSRDDRHLWSRDSFWQKPTAAPITHALAVLDREAAPADE
ncbi:hypothetical protein BC828DRAFT_413154 [Blastocladiella britannica]|nr:hypothetical protein BC828DRAFT_413154 [Blastocladiella britannica]